MADTNGFKKMGTGAADVGRAGVQVAAAGASGFATLGRAGAGMASGAAGIAGTLMSSVARVATKHPKLAALAGLYAGVKGVQHVVGKNKEKKAAAEEMNAAPATVQSYDPRAYGAQSEAVAQPVSVAPSAPQQQTAAEAGTPDQDAFIREVLAAQKSAPQQQPQTSAPAPEQKSAVKQGDWRSMIEQERNAAQQRPSSPNLG